uniref:Fatty acid amide hydrolase 2 n=1 Tax=Cairina moschata TaxID=8855 RepID=A0A8C3B6R2_CAIMO
MSSSPGEECRSPVGLDCCSCCLDLANRSGPEEGAGGENNNPGSPTVSSFRQLQEQLVRKNLNTDKLSSIMRQDSLEPVVRDPCYLFNQGICNRNIDQTLLSILLLFHSASGASVVAIDNKIEQAMDLVKNHLMYAVPAPPAPSALSLQAMTPSEPSERGPPVPRDRPAPRRPFCRGAASPAPYAGCAPYAASAAPRSVTTATAPSSGRRRRCLRSFPALTRRTRGTRGTSSTRCTRCTGGAGSGHGAVSRRALPGAAAAAAVPRLPGAAGAGRPLAVPRRAPPAPLAAAAASPPAGQEAPAEGGDVRGGGGSLHREDQGGEPADQRHRQGQVRGGSAGSPAGGQAAGRRSR